jgi:hypothetical protein
MSDQEEEEENPFRIPGWYRDGAGTIRRGKFR